METYLRIYDFADSSIKVKVANPLVCRRELGLFNFTDMRLDIRGIGLMDVNGCTMTDDELIYNCTMATTEIIEINDAWCDFCGGEGCPDCVDEMSEADYYSYHAHHYRHSIYD